jgi:hypothetical protein
MYESISESAMPAVLIRMHLPRIPMLVCTPLGQQQSQTPLHTCPALSYVQMHTQLMLH